MVCGVEISETQRPPVSQTQFTGRRSQSNSASVSSQLWKIVFITNLNSTSEDIYLSTVATTHFLIEFTIVGGGSVVTDIHFNITKLAVATGSHTQMY